MPRHPPYARNKTHGHTNNQGINTKTQKRKILASTIQFSHNTTPHTTNHKHCSRVRRAQQEQPSAAPDTQQCTNEKPLLSRKTGVSTNPNTTQHTPQPGTTITTFDDTATCGYASTRQNNNSGSHTLGDSTTHTHNCGQTIKLLRKEVIQPHLPVRLPCYDFVPIADPTFDSSL